MFDQERFIEDCRAAVAEDPNHKAVREIVACAVAAPAEVLKGLARTPANRRRPARRQP
jgi:hypothetical protein